MARYDTFKYGDGTLYGVTSTSNLLWSFLVAWDGTYTGDNEASRMVDLKVSRGRDNFINPGGNGFERLPDGRITAILNNDDGRYDPLNSSSPIYPNVKPGKFFRLLVKNGTSGTEYPVMRGIVNDIQPVGGRKRQVRITGIDGMRWLRDRQVYLGLHSSVLISGLLPFIYNNIDWPTEWGTTTGNSVDTLDYWWAWQEKALDAIYALEDAEVGHFWIDREGKATFRGRDYSWSVRQTITQSSMLKEVVTPQPWEVVRNVVRIYSYPKILDAVNTILWQLRDIPSVVNGATFKINAEYRYTSFKVCGSSITFTHTVNAQADGGGADLTASCPLTYGEIGEGTEITIVNNAGSTGYIILLKATGDAIYAPNSSILEDSDSTSKSAYGPRVFTMNSKWQEDTNIAKSLATQLLAYLKDPAPLPVFQVEARPTVQFNLDVYDRLTLTIAELSINGDYRVGKIEHSWLSDNGQAVRTVVKTEPYYELT